jgi:hypothetical protein
VAEVGNLPVLKKANVAAVGTEQGLVTRGGEVACAEEGQRHRGRVVLVLKKASVAEVGREEGQRYQRWGLRKASLPEVGSLPVQKQASLPELGREEGQR